MATYGSYKKIDSDAVINGQITVDDIAALAVTAEKLAATLDLSAKTTTFAGTIVGATINNSSIGASTRNSGAFTTLAANGAVTLTAGTASSGTGNGTLVVTGGVGVSGNTYATEFYGSGSNLTGISTSGRLLSMNVYTTGNPWDYVNSTYSTTWTRPAGCNSVLVYATGGGAGSRLNDQDYRGATGGAGGTAIKWITGVASSVSISVGGGGGYARNGGQSSGGRTSSFGGYCSGYGGEGCNSDYWHFGGEGGGATGGDLNIYGGGGGMNHGSNVEMVGAGSFWGGGRRGHHAYQRGNNESEALNGRTWGSGGGNGYYSQNISSYGGNGAGGCVVVFNYS